MPVQQQARSESEVQKQRRRPGGGVTVAKQLPVPLDPRPSAAAALGGGLSDEGMGLVGRRLELSNGGAWFGGTITGFTGRQVGQ